MRLLLVALLLTLSPARALAALDPVASFGSNPGALDLFTHVPADLPDGAPLVVVLHGCSQVAADMEHAGWSALADELGFAVIYPQQRTANNPVRCFNWAGEYGDLANLTRGQGENASIVSMVDYMVTTHGVDADRVFVAGFSAGAGFTAVLLATWPDRFAAGAIMSGLPYRCATSVQQAYDCQQLNLHTERQKTASAWGDLVRAAAPAGTTVWPRVQIWHGTSDGIVSNLNEAELIEQWTDVHGTDATADATETTGAVARTAYTKNGAVVVEAYTVTGMNHAVCTGRTDPDHPCGPTSASYYEDRGTCSTWRAAAFFGLTGEGPGGDDVEAPAVDVAQPFAGATVSGTVTVVVAASDDVGVASVALSIDGVELGTDDTAPYQFVWTTTGTADGTHALIATARDAAGHEAIDDDTDVVVANDGGGPGGDDEPGDDAGDGGLPGCSLDAGGRGGRGAAVLALVVAIALRTGRRAPRRDRRRP